MRAAGDKIVRLFVSMALLGLSVAARAHAETITSQEEYQIKAAFLYNFGKFVEWPAEYSQKTNDEFVIGIYGPDPFGQGIDELMKDETINNRRVAVRRYKDINSVGPCHILFITVEDPRRLREILDSPRSKNTLTVGQGEEFIHNGGMIAFYIEDERIRFEVNKKVTDESGLQISSQLLKLARIVNSG